MAKKYSFIQKYKKFTSSEEFEQFQKDNHIVIISSFPLREGIFITYQEGKK